MTSPVDAPHDLSEVRANDALGPFVPRAHVELLTTGRRHLADEVALVFADISGFTALNEKLARRGREGTELMVEVLELVFGGLLDTAADWGGDLLAFGGDALLLRFSGIDHVSRAAGAASEMQQVFAITQPAVTRIQPSRLGISMGLESGRVAFLSLGRDRRYLVIAGATVDRVLAAEAAAAAGEVVVGELATAELDLEMGADGRARLAGHGDESKGLDRSVRDAQDNDVDLHSLLSPPLDTALSQGAPLGEHRRVASAFVRFQTDQLPWRAADDRALFSDLDPLVAHAETSADAAGVTILNIDIAPGGGKIVMVAGAPASRGDDLDRALAATRAIVGYPSARNVIDLNGGVNAGVVFCGSVGSASMRAYAVIGDTVNTAARLMAAAPTGSVLCEAAALTTSTLVFQHGPVEQIAAKGKADPIAAVRIDGDGSPRPESDEADRTPFVGRAREIERIATRLRAASEGQGQTVEVVGPAGIGKSRLIEELAERCAPAMSLTFRGGWYAQGSAFRALSEGLRPLLSTHDEPGLRRLVDDCAPELAPHLPLLGRAFGIEIDEMAETSDIDPAFRAEWLAGSVAEILVRATRRPTLIVVEDAHWIDAASSSVLDQLVRHPVEGIAMVVTRRPDSGGWTPGSRDELVELGPLEDSAVASFISTRSDALLIDPHRLAELTSAAAGHPLFLAALIDAASAGDAALPGSVEDALRAELDRHPPDTRLVLGLIAVLGGVVDLDLLTLTTGWDVDTLRDVLRSSSDLVVMSGGEVRFTHALRRTVAYESLPYRTRRQAHRRAAEVLESRADPSPELLSLHHSMSRNHSAAWQWSLRAADRARTAFSVLNENEFLSRAIAAASHLRTLDQAEIAAVLERLADNLEILGRYDEAEMTYRRALARPISPSDRTRIMSKVGRECAQQGDTRRGLQWCRRAEKAAERHADRVDPLLTQAALLFRTGALEQSLVLYRNAAELARSRNDTRRRAEAIRQIGTIEEQLGRSGISDLTRAIRALERVGARDRAASALVNLGAAYYDRGDWDRALEMYGRSAEIAEPIGDLVLAATALNNMAEIHSDRGELSQARDELTAALNTWRATRYPIGIAVALGNLGRLERRAGNREVARSHLDEALAAFREMDAIDFVLEMHLRNAELALTTLDVRGALKQLSLVDAHTYPPPRIVVASARLRAIAAIHSGDTEQFTNSIEHARMVAGANRLRYEAALTEEIATYARWSAAGRRPARVARGLSRLGISDSGQAQLLGRQSL